ncbi:hypothetical protein [Tenacibaculum sp. 47A_GOM-205m]|uniref:hypothetical protein n=1 Tax=Tenacibaculum sp. 47A_GOM-205m TaxID=1380384 RepID=UPI00048F4F20|nr:hypothetical protein [Tenacibaculum sp. 47A_GOM-205m]
MKQYIAENLPTILGYLFGVGGMFDSYLQRKRRKTDALSGMQSTYDKFVEDYDKKFEEMRKEIKYLKEEHAKEIETLRSKLNEVEAYWQKRYNSLKQSFDNYKKLHP